MPVWYVFFDREVIQREGIDIRFLGPHEASQTKGFYYMVPCSRAEDDLRYKELDKNPRYVKTVASGN